MWTSIAFWLVVAFIGLTGVAPLGHVRKADMSGFIADCIQIAVFVIVALVLAGELH